tara:strand:- start:274 stop:618 length:345 start_codon:yes stop_codon:yes gene_type:complete
MSQAFKISYDSEFGFISESVHVFTSYEIDTTAAKNGCAVTGSVWLDRASYAAASSSLLTYHFTFTPVFGSKADAIDVQAYAHLRAIDASKGNTTNLQDSKGGVPKFNFKDGLDV